MRRAALAVLTLASLALVSLAVGPSRAGPLDHILGAFRRAPEPPSAGTAFPRAAPSPSWEAELEHADPAAGETLFTTGNRPDAVTHLAACQSCHGRGGVPPPGAPNPRLAGVTADYIAKELDDYRAGRRRNEVMGPIAGAMTPADIGAVSLYLASLTPAKWENSPASGNDRGRRLQELGDNARAIPACGNCHGPQGRGTDQQLPPLAGLQAEYLRTQLREWQHATRSNDDEGVMRAIGARLSEDDIRSLADYYASMR